MFLSPSRFHDVSPPFFMELCVSEWINLFPFVRAHQPDWRWAFASSQMKRIATMTCRKKSGDCNESFLVTKLPSRRQSLESATNFRHISSLTNECRRTFATLSKARLNFSINFNVALHQKRFMAIGKRLPSARENNEPFVQRAFDAHCSHQMVSERYCSQLIGLTVFLSSFP